LIVYIFQQSINLKKLKSFASVFLILFVFSPLAYTYISITKTDKRTDYPGKEIAIKVKKKWDENFTNKIEFVYGDEWQAGNLSYHLLSRPKWIGWVFKSESPLERWRTLKASYIQIGDWVTEKNCWNGFIFKIDSLNIICIADNK